MLFRSAQTPNNVMGRTIAALCVAARLPGISGSPNGTGSSNFVDGGGLMAYVENREEQSPLLAGYVVRILNGEKPGNLPVPQPTRIDLVLNLKAAKELGVTFPLSLLVQAARVIE